jgi:uncharacterized damage-inducible protein DinB
MNALLVMNVELLDQAIMLVREQSGDHYTRCCGEVFSSSIGQHIRHCVEHYEEFLLALGEGRDLDYENRPRDLSLESDTQEAIQRLEGIREALAGFGDQDRKLGVWDTGAISPAPSSASREMQYLMSHTVHHFALIAVISSLGGIQVPKDFGVAPSTLKYRESA